MIETSKEYIPCHEITIRPQDKPWMNADVQKTLKVRNRLYRRYQRTRNQEHWETYNRVRDEVNQKITAAKDAHKNKMIAKLQNLQRCPKNFWSVAKTIYGTKVKASIPTLTEDGTSHTTSEQKATLLASYYASLSLKPALPDNYRLPELQDDGVPTLENITVTNDETVLN